MTLHFCGIPDAYLADVERFYVCNCELSVVFRENHQYKTIEEIDSILNLVGINVGNFFFKGVEAYSYDPQMPDEVYEEMVNKETSILCMIPEYIREEFNVVVTE